jgi:hypothetical protein
MRLAMTLCLLLASTVCAGGELPANTWVKLSAGGIGPKFSPGMVYSPKLKRLVLFGGAIGRYPKGGPFPYDVLSAAAGSGEWRNEFPQGSGWTPEAGPAKVPAWKGYRFSTKDVKGNVRPHMRHTQMYNQYCLDTDGNAVWAIIADRTMRLDLATMKWEDFGYKETPRGLKWASMCYDPVNKEVVLFGGAHKQPQLEGQTWLLSTEKREWRKLKTTDKLLDPLRREATDLHARIRTVTAIVRNRLHKTESSDVAKIDITARRKALLAAGAALRKKLESVRKGTPAQGRRVAAAIEKAEFVGFWLLRFDKDTPEAVTPNILEGYQAEQLAAQTLQDVLAAQPPPRLMAPMVFVPSAKKIVMFGGDRWDRMCNETWIYDCATRTWERKTPAVNPSPRGAHALLYLPKSNKVLLIGGYTYRTSMSYSTNLYQAAPFEMWTYDVKTNVWERVKHTGKTPLVSHVGRAPVAVAAGVTEEDVIQLTGLGKGLGTWAIRVEPAPHPDGSEKTGKDAFAETRRGLCFDPAWFDEAVKTAKPDAVAAKLKALPPNKWVAMSPPRRLFNRDWGTQVFDPRRDQILFFSGGHSAYCGTAPAHYSIKLNRWSIGFAPELPMEHTYSARVGGTSPASTFSGRPFAPHTYKSYCYDPATKKLVWLHESKVWVYDPDRRDWKTKRERTPFYAERHTTVACPTPRGIAAWAVPAGKSVYWGWRGLWLMTDTAKNEWKTLVKPDKKSLFPTAYGDRHGMCYDSKRDRLYLFHFGLKAKHKIAVYDFKTGKSEVIEPKGKASFPAAASVGREPVYVPGQDVVFIASSAKGGPITLLYDPAANAWLRMEPTFDKGKRGRAIRPGHGVGTGVMWDPGRKCLWASNWRGQIYVMKFDRKTANVKPLE